MNLEAVKTILSKEITFKSDSQRYTFYKKIKNDPNHDDFTVQLAYALVLYDDTYQSHMEKLKEKDIELERLTRENDEYMENELLNRVKVKQQKEEIQQLKEENKRLLALKNFGN